MMKKSYAPASTYLIAILLSLASVQAQSAQVACGGAHRPAIQTVIVDHLQSFADGEVPDFSNPQQMALFHIYRLKYLGDPTTQLLAETNQLVLEAQKANPGIKKERFNSIKVDFKSPLALPEEMSKLMQQTKQSAQKQNGNFYQVSANSGFWNKVLETVPQKANQNRGVFASLANAVTQTVTNLVGNPYKKFLSSELVLKLESDKVPAEEKAALLFERLLEIRTEAVTEKGADFVGIRNLSQVMVDLAHSSPFLNKDLSNLLKSNDGMAAIETFDLLLNRRDQFAAAHGLGNFTQMLASFGIKQPTSLPLPHDKFMAQWLKMRTAATSKWNATVSDNDFSVRQLSEAESIYRSCLGANECSSRTYPTRALDPNFQYFTMTDREGHSTGSLLAVLGKAQIDGKEENVAFLDKMQNVSADRISIFVEGVRQSLAEKGYRLIAPQDLGLNEGLTNSTEVRAFFAAYFGQGPGIQAVGFAPHPHAYQFENKYSRADQGLNSFVIGALTNEHFSLTTKETKPFRLMPAGDLQAAAKASYELKNGSDASRILYIKTQESLKALGAADPAFKATVDQWLKSTETSFAVKKQILLTSEPAEILNLATTHLNESEKLRFFTAVVSSPFYRELIGVKEIYTFLEQNPDYIKQLSSQNLSGFSLSRLIKMGSSNLFTAVAEKIPDSKLDKQSAKTGNTAVSEAAATGNLAAIKTLEARGANLILPNLEGRIPLVRSLVNKHSEVAEYLSDRLPDAELNRTDSESNPILYFSIKYDQPGVTVKLLNRGANVRFVDIYGQVVSHGLIEAVKTSRANINMLEKIQTAHPELINEPDAKGYTALMYAAKSGNPEIIQFLLDHGASKSIRTVQGKTAASLAKKAGFDELAAILQP